jgi:phosphoribosylamine--glycine ligase
MKVLIIGGGGREHAIAKKISLSPKVDKLYCAPGNAGIAECAECINIAVNDFNALADFAEKENINLTIVGPDDPLVGGIVDVFEHRGLRVFGPRKDAAIIEGSKVFSKNLMKKYSIPTAEYEIFNHPSQAVAYLKNCSYPIVLKADGLALGKGVLICRNHQEAMQGVKEIMEDKQFGASGDQIVVEQFITGPEVSVLCFCDGTTIIPMTSAQDHKRAKDGDQGLNTGGMGTISPSPFYTKEIDDYCRKYIYRPTIDAMKNEGREFKGVLFVGLMLTQDGPKVLEYNARFGDPETQVILPRMKNDILEVFEACIDGTLDRIELSFEDNAAVCVILASYGYPEQYVKGLPIVGLENFINKNEYYAFHAGTKKSGNAIITNGGRVLGITAIGKDLKEARKKAYEATDWVDFANKYMRTDIGKVIEQASVR